MSGLSNMLEQLRGLDLGHALGLKPPYPRVALEIEHRGMSLVRLRTRRGGPPQLDSYRAQEAAESQAPATIFDQGLPAVDGLRDALLRLFEHAGVRPGKVSLVLPDNLAKISLLSLPERPPSRRQLEEVIRFKMRRGLPFRVSEAAMTYQFLPGEGQGVQLLVALIRRALVERYEQALESVGARPGLVDLCTPNLLNLYRNRIESAEAGGDVALLNCAATYFTLAIVRQSRLIFFRCKTYAMGQVDRPPVNGLLARELGYSLSYYEEKLAGAGIQTLFVRAAETPFDELAGQLASLDARHVELIDPLTAVAPSGTSALDPATAQRLAPALGAALGRV